MIVALYVLNICIVASLARWTPINYASLFSDFWINFLMALCLHCPVESVEMM